jgi:hypothetical protein
LGSGQAHPPHIQPLTAAHHFGTQRALKAEATFLKGAAAAQIVGIDTGVEFV